MTVNLLHALPQALPDEVYTELVRSGEVRIERIVSNGQITPQGQWYDQAEYEWVLLLAGAAGLRFEDEADDRSLVPGDCVLIAPHRRHRVTYTGEQTVWLAVWWPPAR
ncbi:hypothetical protein [Chitinolyticbacter albus]|uniref:hypothetical protein n=1 Tax=Chitinolyticbacter albus TaxID=2961951 RepID=UPI00210A7020|nr:hypothetical protein [Chitinolyticbacter albus]